MSTKEGTDNEKQQGYKAYKRKDFDAAISHFENAMKLNAQNLEFPYRIAMSKFKQKKYDDCIEFCGKAVKVGKRNKGDVKVVAKAYVLEGNARIEAGEADRGREAIEKAVTFLTSIAKVKDAKGELDECSKFIERAIQVGKENVVNVFAMEKVMELKAGLNLRYCNADPKKNQKLFLTRMVDVAEDWHDLKAKDNEQYEFCLGYLELVVQGKYKTVDGEHGNEYFRALALQGKALR